MSFETRGQVVQLILSEVRPTKANQVFVSFIALFTWAVSLSFLSYKLGCSHDNYWLLKVK